MQHKGGWGMMNLPSYIESGIKYKSIDILQLIFGNFLKRSSQVCFDYSYNYIPKIGVLRMYLQSRIR